MLCPLFFLIKINKGEIRTANPPLSAAAKRFDLAVIHNFQNLCIAFANLKPTHSHNNPNPIINYNQHSISVRYILFRNALYPSPGEYPTRCTHGSSVCSFICANLKVTNLPRAYS